jgi:hypothetical protein
MENFRDITHLQLGLQAVFTDEPGTQPGQRYLSDHLQTNRGFTKEQADLYASIVVARNTEKSADQMVSNARKVIGNWVAATGSGMPGEWSNSTQQNWRFSENLTYEYKRQTLESYMSPFGSSYSRPNSSTQQGIWAPCDWEENGKLELVVISFDGSGRRLSLTWTDPAKLALPRSCSLGGQAFSRQY